MVFSGVGAGQQNHVRLFNIPDCVCHRSASECRGQTGHSGGMSETRAMIDIVCFNRRPCEFLHNVVFLIRYPGRCKDSYAVGTVFSLYFAELSGCKRERFIPGCFPEFAVFLYERFRQPFG